MIGSNELSEGRLAFRTVRRGVKGVELQTLGNRDDEQDGLVDEADKVASFVIPGN